MEIRLHGRGGQGGVTCAKILAAVYAELGSSVQAFGDYASERSGAPVRAYTRVSDGAITNRNKVYEPDHLIVLDAHLLGADTVAGLRPGGAIIINTPAAPETIARRFPGFRIATIDATEIARRWKIGSRSVVIINTTIAGAAAKVLGLPFERLESVYRKLGFLSNLAAAREAAATVREKAATGLPKHADAPVAARAEIRPLVEHASSAPTGIKTGAWRSQQPSYVEHLAPCNAWCPAGNDVVGFIQALAGEGEAAGATILSRTNPLAGTCGRVCPAPCMEGCNRAEYDGAVNIRGLERWLADHAQPIEHEIPTPAEPRRIAVIGGGPAGLGAAFEIARQGHRATIIEREAGLGGLMETGIPTYRLPRAVVAKDIANITRLGVETRSGIEVGAEELAKLANEFDGLILATGLQRLRTLDVPGLTLEGIEQGLHFLRRLNRGEQVGSMGHVLVMGGGNTAIDCARSALRCGADSVTIVYRRTRLEMPAIAEEIEQATEEGVSFLFSCQPLGFQGREGRVTAVELAEVDLGDPDETGRRRPITSDRRSSLACDRVLLALGQSADLSFLPEGWEMRDGQVWQGERPLPIFAAGDVVSGEGTITHAVGSGRRTANRALRDLGCEIEALVRPERSRAVPATDIRVDHFAGCPSAREHLRPAAARTATFTEVSAGLDNAMEAHRCFSCGHCVSCDRCLVYCPEGSIHRAVAGYDVDYGYCKGCGICVAECPREGMEMVDL